MKLVPGYNGYITHIVYQENYQSVTPNQGLVKGAKLCLNPYFFGWLEK